MSPLFAATALALLAVLAGNLLRLPALAAGSKAAALLPVDVTVGMILAVGVLNALRARRWRVDRPMQWGLAFVSVAAVGVITAPLRTGLSLREVMFGGAYLVRWTAYLGVGLVLGSFLQKRETLQIVRLFGLVVFIFAVFGIGQSLFFPGFAQQVYPTSGVYVDWDPQGRRLVSTFLDPNYAGILIVTGLCWWAGRLISGAKAPLWEGAVLGTAMVLTLSRGSMLGFACAAVTLVIARGVSKRAMRAGVIAALVLLVVSPLLIRYAAPYNKLDVDASALQRVLSWQRAWEMLSDYPWLGIGFNTTGFMQTRYGWVIVGNASFGLDGGVLFIATLTGILGLGCFVIMLISLMRRARTLWQSECSAEERAVGYAAAASVVAVTVQATFANTLLLALMLVPCWILWSAPLALLRAEEP